MELIHWGDTIQNEDWHVLETVGPGYVRVYQVTSGNVFYEDSYGKVRLEENDIYILPSHSPFEVVHDKNVVFACTWVHLNLYPILVKKLVHIPVEKGGHYDQVFDMLRFFMQEKEKSLYVLQKCAEIFTHYCYKEGYLKKISSSFQDVVYDMEKKACRDISISAIATEFGYTTEHFIRIFKKELGITPYQFIVGYRMVKACEYLRNKESVMEVSEKVGYHDIKTFERAFKSYHGRTASDYKKKYKDMP